jgi:hypothetical protein
MRESELVSHKAFERFCELRGFRAEPIQRAAAPTPDYKVWIGPKCYVVELKQLDPNDEDERQRQELETVGHTAWKGTSGKRARNKVGKARRQLTSWARRGVPTLLVLFDNTGPNTLGVHIDTYAIKTAMHGSDEFLFARCEGSSQPLGWVSGNEPTIPTSFSAMGVLFARHFDDPCTPYLVVYHNDNANLPLDPRCVAAVTEYQYRWQDRRPEEIGCWVHAITGECDEVFGRSSET